MKLFSRIDHVSIAVRDFEKAKDFFERIFGAVPGAMGPDEDFDFPWCVFSLGDLTRLELVSPNGGGRFLDEFLAKRKGGVHHITIETPDIKRVKDHLDKNGVRYFGYSEELDNWKELFIHPKESFGVLIQIAEFNPNEWLPDSMKLPDDGPKWAIEARGKDIDLAIAHPGGGKATLELNKEEVKSLISELEKVL